MITTYRFILEPFIGRHSKHKCPNCSKERVFRRYVDSESGKYLANHVGWCDRKNNCNYHYPPRQFFKDCGGFGAWESGHRFIPITQQEAQRKRRISQLENSSISFTSKETFEKTRKDFQSNSFVQGLLKWYPSRVIKEAADNYRLGSYNLFRENQNYTGVVFWQIDFQNRIRAGKIMVYDPRTLKRIKSIWPTWMHRFSREEYNLKQCLYGEHLLNVDPEKDVALVESEKSAIIGSIHFPRFIWLATGGWQGLKKEAVEPLKGRRVFLFPDLGMYAKWEAKAYELSSMGVEWKVTDYLERTTSIELKEVGGDLADLLLDGPYQPEKNISYIPSHLSNFTDPNHQYYIPF